MRILDQTGAAETQGPIDEQNMLRWQTTDAFSGSHGLRTGRPYDPMFTDIKSLKHGQQIKWAVDKSFISHRVWR